MQRDFLLGALAPGADAQAEAGQSIVEHEQFALAWRRVKAAIFGLVKRVAASLGSIWEAGQRRCCTSEPQLIAVDMLSADNVLKRACEYCLCRACAAV
jgi:hypothetical protein